MENITIIQNYLTKNPERKAKGVKIKLGDYGVVTRCKPGIKHKPPDNEWRAVYEIHIVIKKKENINIS